MNTHFGDQKLCRNKESTISLEMGSLPNNAGLLSHIHSSNYQGKVFLHKNQA